MYFGMEVHEERKRVRSKQRERVSGQQQRERERRERTGRTGRTTDLRASPKDADLSGLALVPRPRRPEGRHQRSGMPQQHLLHPSALPVSPRSGPLRQIERVLIGESIFDIFDNLE